MRLATSVEMAILYALVLFPFIYRTTILGKSDADKYQIDEGRDTPNFQEGEKGTFSRTPLLRTKRSFNFYKRVYRNRPMYCKSNSTTTNIIKTYEFLNKIVTIALSHCMFLSVLFYLNWFEALCESLKRDINNISSDIIN